MVDDAAFAVVVDDCDIVFKAVVSVVNVLDASVVDVTPSIGVLANVLAVVTDIVVVVVVGASTLFSNTFKIANKRVFETLQTCQPTQTRQFVDRYQTTTQQQRNETLAQQNETAQCCHQSLDDAVLSVEAAARLDSLSKRL